MYLFLIVLLCGLLIVALLEGVLLLIYKRGLKKQAPQLPPEILEKTKNQLFTEIRRHEQTESLLRETQDYLHCMINSIPSCLIGVTSQGIVTHWNLAAIKTTQKETKEAMGRHINEVYPELPISTSIIQKTISEQTPFRKENFQIGKGYQAKFLDLAVYPLVGDDVKGAVILTEDVTPRVRVEHMMIQNEKMMGLGEMAAGLAHEINNPLAGILNNAQNIMRRTSSELEANKKVASEIGINLEDVETYLRSRDVLKFTESIRESGARAAHIVKNMLEFSRSGNTNHEDTDIIELIEQSLELTFKSLELKTGFGIEVPNVSIIVEDNLPQVRCSKIEIQQVFMNLIRNASQAFQSDEYGAPLDPRITINISLQADDMIIEFEDNGPGMSETIKNHIFEPFFTTKDVGKGTGLGLSVSYFIITEHHKGSIAVDSRPGEGTTFIIHLPLKKPHQIENSKSD